MTWIRPFLAYGAGIVLSCLAPAPVRCSAAPVLTILGTLPGERNSFVTGMSADGGVVVGMSGSRPFRWTAQGGMQELDAVSGGAGNSTVTAISADGSTAVGRSAGYPCRWQIGSPPQNLGPAPLVMFAQATAVSGDGSEVVGYGSAYGGGPFPVVAIPFRWKQSTGMSLLSPEFYTLNSDDELIGVAMIASGDRVTGWRHRIGSVFRAVVVNRAGSLTPIGPLDGGLDTFGTCMSADGSKVGGFGNRFPSGADRFFRWAEGSGLQDLGHHPSGANSYAFCMSGNGWAMGGSTERFYSPAARACFWTPMLGVVDLNTHLSSLGTGMQGMTLASVNGLSTDGAVFAGWGFVGGQQTAFVVTGFPPASGACYANCDASTTAPILSVVDFACFLKRFRAADPYADCDRSGSVNVIDFACFLNRFQIGCAP